MGRSATYRRINDLYETTHILVIAAADWTDLLTVLIVGLSIALALQVLLVCLGSAVTFSLLRFPFSQVGKPTAANTSSSHAKPPGAIVGTIAGLGILFTVNLVLFIASFLATTFTHFGDPATGAIAGLVLWAAYLVLVLWLSVTTVNSLTEGFLNIITVGLRRIVSTSLGLFRHQNDEQQLLRARITNEIREEVQQAFNTLESNLLAKLPSPQPPVTPPFSAAEAAQPAAEPMPLASQLQPSLKPIWQKLATYLKEASAKKLTPKQLDRTLSDLFGELNIALPATDLAPLMDHESLITILNQRQDLSEKKKARIIQQIQTTWKAMLPPSPATRAEVNSELIPTPSPDVELEPKQQTNSATLDPDILHAAIEALSQQVLAQIPGFLQQTEMNWSALAGTLSQANLEAAIAPIIAAINSDDVKHQLEQLLAQSQSSWVNVSHDIETQAEQLVSQAGQLRQRVMTQIASTQQSIQQGAQTRLQLIQQDMQNRLEATRKTLSAVAWWLFATLLTSATAAALAGAIASGFDPRQFLP